MNNLVWDESVIDDFFDYSGEVYDFEDENATIYKIADCNLKLEIVLLPVRGVMCFTLHNTSNTVLVDLSVAVYTSPERRVVKGLDCLYCHECTVLPGLHAYSSSIWYQFYDYLKVKFKPISFSITRKPHISIRFWDTDPQTRT